MAYEIRDTHRNAGHGYLARGPPVICRDIRREPVELVGRIRSELGNEAVPQAGERNQRKQIGVDDARPAKWADEGGGNKHHERREHRGEDDRQLALWNLKDRDRLLSEHSASNDGACIVGCEVVE